MTRRPAEERIAPVAVQLGHQVGTTATRMYQQNAYFINRYGRWLLMAWLAALADGKLFLAIAASTLTYRLVTRGYQVSFERLEPFCDRLRHQLIQVVYNPLGASVLAFASTYGCIAVWAELGAGWAGTTFVGLGLMNLLAWSRTTSEPPRSSLSAEPVTPDPLTSHWHNLTAQDSLKRLMAVRSLLHWNLSADDGAAIYLPGTAVTARSHLIDCFRVMLTHETEPLVRVALIEGLKALQPKPQLTAGQPAMQPLVTRTPQLEHEHSVEYVEP
ncbi:MAG: hypothetical protein AAFX01_11080 [Cyanobacteria bacterium J06638_28]